MVKKQSNELSTQEAALPAYLKDYRGPSGAEDISSEDVTIPRIKLAQSLSPEVKEGVVPDGALFLNISGEILAVPGAKLRFTPVAMGKEFILWNPTRGEGILARARRVLCPGGARYEWDKQNEDFEVKFKNGPKITWHTKRYVDENGMDEWGSLIPGDKDSGIAATAHYNYVVVLPDHGNMIAALSLSRSQVKRAKDLNALFRMNAAPIFARVFNAESVAEKNDDGAFFNFKFSPAGFVSSPDDFEAFKQFHESFKQSGFNVDQSNSDDSQEGTSI